MKRKIAYLISQYPALSHTFILREIQQLRGMGFDIEVASINKPDRTAQGLSDEEQDESKECFYVKEDCLKRGWLTHLKSSFSHPIRYFASLAYALCLGVPNLRQTVYGLFYWAEAVVLADWMERQSLQWIHVHFATPASTVALILTRFKPDVSFSMTVHGPDEFYEVSKYHLRRKLEEASLVCCIGEFTRSQLMLLADPSQWSKFEVVRLGVDPDSFRPSGEGRSPEVFEVLCVGRLVAAKGQHILLAAIKQLAKEGRSIRLRLVGDGPDRKRLEQRVGEDGILREHVVFEGGVRPDLIKSYYSKADLFALASFAEGIPVVLMEAMSMELPVISTWITGIPELISDQKDGFLVPASNVDLLADRIRTLMDNLGFRLHLGREARSKILRSYDLRRNARQLGEVFDRYLDDGFETGKPVEEMFSMRSSPAEMVA
jgi:glycosyltransferase involved in cell wall biosynthesis